MEPVAAQSLDHLDKNAVSGPSVHRTRAVVWNQIPFSSSGYGATGRLAAYDGSRLPLFISGEPGRPRPNLRRARRAPPLAAQDLFRLRGAREFAARAPQPRVW